MTEKVSIRLSLVDGRPSKWSIMVAVGGKASTEDEASLGGGDKHALVEW